MTVLSTLLATAGLDLAAQWLGWAYGAWHRTEKYYDLTGSATYVGLVAWHCLRRRHHHFTARQKMNALLVVLWALRLGSFLFARIRHDGGRDSRFDKVRDRPKIFFMYWSIQALWIFLTALPVWALLSDDDGDAPDVRARDAAGWALWALGFAIQATADAQKRAFRADAANAGRWIASGLWRYSQHPNYFGEIAMWAGIALSCSSRVGPWVALASPAFVAFLLTRMSGIPLLDRAGDRKWGKLAAYRRYRAQTSVLVPWWPTTKAATN